jgi:hypothetical protein
MTDPGSDSLPRRLGDLELNGPLRLLLQHDCPRCHSQAMADIPHLQTNEITGTKFAVDGQIEQGKFAPLNGELQSNSNGPGPL